MKLLDAGAYGIICPMINSRAECEAFVGACRYAPTGYRSFGPVRATWYAGADYFKHANETVITMGVSPEPQGTLDQGSRLPPQHPLAHQALVDRPDDGDAVELDPFFRQGSQAAGRAGAVRLTARSLHLPHPVTRPAGTVALKLRRRLSRRRFPRAPVGPDGHPGAGRRLRPPRCRPPAGGARQQKTRQVARKSQCR